jgi:hypothetical protein
MQTRDDCTDTAIGHRRRLIWLIVCLVLPTWFLLVFELFGGSRYGKNPIHLGGWEALIGLAFALVVINPALVALGFVILIIVFWKRNALRIRGGLLSMLLLLLTLSFLIDMFSVLATFGGHPVWVDGYR